MSQPNNVVLDYNYSISLSPAVAAAYRSNISVLANMPAFVDRVLYLNTFIDSVSAWRSANCITQDQLVWMLRSVRELFQRDLGIISDSDIHYSAIEAEERNSFNSSLSLVD